jgi:hypothetical protein
MRLDLAVGLQLNEPGNDVVVERDERRAAGRCERAQRPLRIGRIGLPALRRKQR